MDLNLSRSDCQSVFVDRDSTSNDYGHEGMDVIISGLRIHFEDEEDAADVAQRILKRLGKLP